jgi:hypothetical protein
VAGVASQTLSNPCQQTTRIVLSFTPEVPLFPRCTPQLTITGLTGTCSESEDVEVRSKDGVIGVQNTSSLTWVPALINGADGSGWGQVIASAWEKEAGALTILSGNFEQIVEGGHELVLSFFLRRGTDADDGVDILTLETSGITGEAHSVNLVLGSGSEKPLKVDDIVITAASIAQSTRVPCSNSSVTVDFELSHNVDTICEPSVIVSGLTGKLTPSGKLQVRVIPEDSDSGAPTVVAGDWAQDTGTLTLNLMGTGQAFVPDPAYEFLPDASSARVEDGWIFKPAKKWRLEFDILHPAFDDETKVFSIEVQLTGSCQNKILTKVAQQQAAGADVLGVQLLKKSIGQSQPCPCSKNIISITLSVSQPLFFTCGPVITITGLTGSQTPDSLAFEINEVDASGDGIKVMKTVGSWTRLTGELIIPLATSMMDETDVVFSFELLNQAAPQAAPNVSIKIGPNFVSTPVAMDRDGASIPVDPSSPSEVIDAGVGDAQPLKIWAIRFMEKKIGQSTPFPGCENTLTVTLSFNCPIDPISCPGTYVRISNLIDNSTASHSSALVTPVRSFQSPTGPLSLSGMQHLVLNPTRTDKWWAV